MNQREKASPAALSPLISVISVCVLAAAVPVAAQEGASAPEPEEAFFERVEVNLVTVDVVVTDKRGNPVTGLGRDDFEIFEDGRPMAITNFYAVEGGARLPPPPPTPPTPPAATAPALPRPAPVPEEVPLQLIVYVDNLNIRPTHRTRVFRDVRRFLNQQIAGDDRVMLVSYERSLKVKQGLTSDPQLIANALFELEESATDTTQRDEERRTLIERIEEARSPEQVRTWLRVHSQSVQNDLRGTLRAVEEMVTSLAGLPGRKALLYVSDGLPMTPGEEFYVATQSIFPNQSFILDARSFDAHASFETLALL